MTITANERQYLKRALQLAARARGCTAPNPMVGAVIVRDGIVVGEGYHRRAGEAHAEIHALRDAGARAQGAALYVSLEPCAHFGKTPPCADAIIAAGITRVVFASQDPNPCVDGQGRDRLLAAGIDVDFGAFAEEEARLNEAWRYWILHRQPFVTLKLAASLDGKLATCTGEARWITGEAARHDVHRLRAVQDAILTTSATVLTDDPALTARVPRGRDPRRVVVDTRARTSPAAQVYQPAAHPPILATAETDEARLAPFRARGVEIVQLPAPGGCLDLRALMAELGKRDILSLLVEAGGTFAAALLQAGLAHKLRLYLAPLLIGGAAAPTIFDGAGFTHLCDAPRLHDITWKRIGEDLRLEAYLPAIP